MYLPSMTGRSSSSKQGAGRVAANKGTYAQGSQGSWRPGHCSAELCRARVERVHADWQRLEAAAAAAAEAKQPLSGSVPLAHAVRI